MPATLRALARYVAAAAVLHLLGAGTVLAQEAEQTAPFFTTPDEVTVQMLRFAGVGPADLVADLGSGDGRIVITAAREFGARGLGIEIDPKLVVLSRQLADAAGVSRHVEFRQEDVLLADFARASVVTVYLLPALINRLQPRLLDELIPGTRIVSHAFAMRGWAPDRTHTVRLSRPHEGQGDTSTLHLWIVPAKVRGRWREAATGGEAPAWELTVEQNFQHLDIEVRRAGEALPVRKARLEGRSLSWEAQGLRFEGEVATDRMRGRLAGPAGERTLELHRAR